MLVSEIVRRVRDSAGDTNVLQFTNQTLTDWINDAVREIVVDQSLLQASATSSTVVGQSDYTLPADFFKLHSVTWRGRKLNVVTLEKWQQMHAEDYSNEAENAPPVECYVWANTLTLYPPPDSVDNLVIQYTKMPTDITYDGNVTWDPTTPVIHSSYHQRIVDYCLAQVALQDEDNYKYNMLMQQFRGDVRENTFDKEEEDLYPFISVSARDAGSWDEYYG